MKTKFRFLARISLLFSTGFLLISCVGTPEPEGLNILLEDAKVINNTIYLGVYEDEPVSVFDGQDATGYSHLWAQANYDNTYVLQWYYPIPHYIQVDLFQGNGKYIHDQVRYYFTSTLDFDTGSATPFVLTSNTQVISSIESAFIQGFLTHITTQTRQYIQETEAARLSSLDVVKERLSEAGYTIQKQDRSSIREEAAQIEIQHDMNVVLNDYYLGVTENVEDYVKIYVLNNQTSALVLYHRKRYARKDHEFVYRTHQVVVLTNTETTYQLLVR